VARVPLNTIAEALVHARHVFNAVSQSAGLDAQVLLAHVCGKERAWLLAHGEAVLSGSQGKTLLELLERVAKGEPLPYILGEWEFYDLIFNLSPHVLIPRPETEMLIEAALGWLAANPARRKAVDVGTGSGCIAITLAYHVPDLDMTASDISADALHVARSNAERHGLGERVHFSQADLLENITAPFDLICANLPYIDTVVLKGLAVYGREPSLALDGGPQGLDLLARLLEQAPLALAPGGLILLEIDASQGETAKQLARGFFPRAQIDVRPDLAGHPRLVVISTRNIHLETTS